MEEKTTAIRRELLLQIITKHGSLEKKVLVKKIKDAGIYKNFMSDEEVYDLAEKFAAFHGLPIGYVEPKKEFPIGGLVTEPTKYVEQIDEEGESKLVCLTDEQRTNVTIVKALEKEHELLTKRLLTVNKLLALYKD